GVAYTDDVIPLLLGAADEDELLLAHPRDPGADLVEHLHVDRAIALVGFAPAQVLLRLGPVCSVGRLRPILEEVDHHDRPFRAALDHRLQLPGCRRHGSHVLTTPARRARGSARCTRGPTSTPWRRRESTAPPRASVSRAGRRPGPRRVRAPRSRAAPARCQR